MAAGSPPTSHGPAPFTQLASELLGIDAAKIEIAMGDSDRVGGAGSMGSRSAYIGGSAAEALHHGRSQGGRAQGIGQALLEENRL